MARDDLEVGVLMEQGHAGPDRNGCDQAVGQAPDRRSFPSTRPVESSRRFEVGRLLQGEKTATTQEATQIAGMPFVARARKDLEQNKAGRCEPLVGVDRCSHAPVSRASGGTLELDPGRTVNEDHADERR